MDETGIGAERDVVEEQPARDEADVDAPLGPAGERLEGAERVAPVEADVVGEVVARAARDANDGGFELDCRLSDLRERAVAPRDAEDLGARGARELPRILTVPQHVCLDSELPGCLGDLLG